MRLRCHTASCKFNIKNKLNQQIKIISTIYPIINALLLELSSHWKDNLYLKVSIPVKDFDAEAEQRKHFLFIFITTFQ